MKYFQKPSLLLLGITFSLIGCLSEESKDPVGTSSIMTSSSSVALQSSIIGSSLVASSTGKSSSLAVSSILASSSSVNLSSSQGVVYGSLTDSRDNQVYKTVVIGSQTWMAQNLNYGTYISDGASGAVYQKGVQKFCYSNTESNCTTDGGLYQWHTAMGFASSCAKGICASQISIGNHQGICPAGWHVPKSTEWDALQTYLGGWAVAGSKMKLNNTGSINWDDAKYNSGNSSGFSALPSGYRNNNGDFKFRRFDSFFWETTEYSDSLAYRRILYGSYSEFGHNDYYKANGFSLRCVRD